MSRIRKSNYAVERKIKSNLPKSANSCDEVKL